MEISELKYNLNKKVRLVLKRHYVDSVYVLTAGIIRRDEQTGEFFYQAEVKDSSGSVSIVSLDDVHKEVTDGILENGQRK